MEITERKQNGINIMGIQGRLDTSSAPELEARLNALLDLHEKDYILDCREMEYISSSGLRVFLSLLKRTAQMNGKLVLFGLSQSIAEIFTIAGFEKYFILKDDEAGALDYFQ
ncbi:MAG TPA: STAS domain-containing protein [Bacteroidales bacterium]|nr:STAS domain-containing protein [Bacteroidales bacterium]HSA44719.1 STAS domain-containing protein [Bacteroidales bacterium]